MKVLHIFNSRNYPLTWQKYIRKAARAVIIKEGKIALVKSKTLGFFKFPGGGIEKNENRTEALIRETREETGLKIIPCSITPLGIIKEKRKGKYDNEIFIQTSYYYFADVEDNLINQQLDEYESEYGFELAWTELKTAYLINEKLGKNTQNAFLVREAFVLKYLIDNYT